MNSLIDYARQQGLDEIAAFALESEETHGIAVGYSALWLYCWKVSQTMEKISMDRHWRNVLEQSILSPRRDFVDSSYVGDFDVVFDTTMGPIDIAWRPPFWYNAKFGSNITIKIHRTPGSQPLDFTRFSRPKEDMTPIIQEYRPQAELCASAKSVVRPLQGGISIGQGSVSSGTLGGILIDSITKQKYGVTCGHVLQKAQCDVDQPSQYDGNGHSNVIGNCILSHFPTPSPQKKCSMFNPALDVDIDLSLIELNDSIASILEVADIGRIRGYVPKDALLEGTAVELRGRTSAYKKLMLGDAIVVKRIKYKGQNYCFKDLIQVKVPSLGNLVLHRPVSGGDSGAWICAQGANGTEWAGMVIAEDRLCGYAITSEDILTWLNGQGYKLECC